MITAAQIRKLFPAAKAELVEAIVANWPQASGAGITTLKRKAMFFAMIGVETGGLKAIVENLNYTTAARIRETWPMRFKTDAAAQPYVRQPTKLANLVYGSRMGNGPPASGDGYRFRGRGMMQTTGRANYAARRFETNPEALQDPATAFLTAVAEWQRRGCNALADAGNIKACRNAINGGAVGLEDAIGFYAKGLKVFTDDKGAMPRVATLASLPELEPDEADEKMPAVEDEVADAIAIPQAASTIVQINDPKAVVSKMRAAGKAGLETQAAQAFGIPSVAGLLYSWFGHLLPDRVTPEMLVTTLLILVAVVSVLTVPLVRWWNRKRVYDAPPNQPAVQIIQPGAQP